MSWEIEYTDEFGEWWETLSEDEQESLAASVRLLEERGPNLRFPHSSGINDSKHDHCENCGLNTMADRSEPCTRSILVAARSC